MPNTTTHIKFIREIQQKYPELFIHIDDYFLYSGSIFPDIYYFIPYKMKYTYSNLSAFWHKDFDFCIEFGEKLLQYSRNYFEVSFALGFISHGILDKHIHKYLKSKKICDKVTHLVAEFYLDAHFNINVVPIPIYPRLLLQKVINEEYSYLPKKYFNQTRINSIKLFVFFIKQLLIRNSINAKYSVKKKMFLLKIFELLKSSFFKIIEKFIFETKLKKVGYKMSDILNPDSKIKDLYLDDMLKVVKKGQTEFIEVLKRYQHKQFYSN